MDYIFYLLQNKYRILLLLPLNKSLGLFASTIPVTFNKRTQKIKGVATYFWVCSPTLCIPLRPLVFVFLLLLRSRENQGLLPLAFGFPLGEN
jgi:hypothetical protein